MCDQTQVSYLPKDIVWVKYSKLWWPGEVQDEASLEEGMISGFKKKPLAVVKFFNEDSYEFPKNLDQIYHYNCLRKDEFIKKGLDMCRTEQKTTRVLPRGIERFPADVKLAEIRTGGNPHYVDDPKFVPEKKFDYRQHFGMTPQKKMKLDRNISSPKPTRVIKTTPKAKLSKPTTTISTPTHIPQPDNAPENQPTNSVKKNNVQITPILQATKKFATKSDFIQCPYCNYKCKSINAYMMHGKSHFRGESYPSTPSIPAKLSEVFRENQKSIVGTERVVPYVPSKKIIPKRKITLEEAEPPKRKKSVSPKVTKRKLPITTVTTSAKVPEEDQLKSPYVIPKKRIKKSKNEIESEAVEILLKDWDDSEDENDNTEKEEFDNDTNISKSEGDLESKSEGDLESKSDGDLESKAGDFQSKSDGELSHKQEGGVPESDDDLSPKLEGKESFELKLKEEEEPTPKPESVDIPSTPLPLKPSIGSEKSCFDFEDNDDALNLDLSLKFGQKLPRVINDKLRQRYREDEQGDALKNEVDNFLRDDNQDDTLQNEVASFLGSAKVPDLPQVPPLLDIFDNKKAEISEILDGEKKKIEGENNTVSIKFTNQEQLSNTIDKMTKAENSPVVIGDTFSDNAVAPLSPTLSNKHLNIENEKLDCSRNEGSLVPTSECKQTFSDDIDNNSTIDIVNKSEGVSLSTLKMVKDDFLVVTDSSPPVSLIDSSFDEDVAFKPSEELIDNKNIIKEGQFKDMDNVTSLTNQGNREEQKGITENCEDSLIIDETLSIDGQSIEDFKTIKKNSDKIPEDETIESTNELRKIANEDTQLVKKDENIISNNCSLNESCEPTCPEKDNMDIDFISNLKSTKETNSEIISCVASVEIKSEGSTTIENTNFDSIKKNQDVKNDISINVEPEEAKSDGTLLKEIVENKAALEKDNQIIRKDSEINIKKDEKQVVNEEVHGDKEKLISASSDLQQSLLDINSMPIVIDQGNDEGMEIICRPGPFIPDPNTDLITVFLREKGEELPEDYEEGKLHFSIPAPPPGFVPNLGFERIPLPETKHVSSNATHPILPSSISPSTSTISNGKVIGAPNNQILIVKPNRNSDDPLTLVKKTGPVTFNPQLQQIVLIPKKGSSGKFVVPPAQVAAASSSENTEKAPVALEMQKNIEIKQAVVNKASIPTTSKTVTVSNQIIGQLKGSPKILLEKRGNFIINNASTPKLVKPTNVLTQMKPPTSIPRPGRISVKSGSKLLVSGHKPLSSGSIFSISNQDRKIPIRMKQSPNILQRNVKKPLGQAKTSHILTIPTQLTRDCSPSVSSNLETTVLQSDQSSGEAVVFLAVDDQGNSVIPLSNQDNRLIDPASLVGNADIFLSINNSNSFIKKSNQRLPTSGGSQKQGDILAEALANTQVLHTEVSDVVGIDSSSIVSGNKPNITFDSSPIEVPTGSQPSMPLLSDDIEMKSQTLYISNNLASIPNTYQLIEGNLSASAGQQLVFTTDLHPEEERIPTSEIPLPPVDSTKEHTVLPELTFTKKPVRSKTGR